MEKRTMGTFLAALRKANGMTQKDVAERLAVTDKAVSRWERDEALPDITFLPALAEMFGVTCDELLKGEKATEPVNDTSENKKSEKQRKVMVNNSLLEYRNRMILSLFISHLGAVLMIIINSVVTIKETAWYGETQYTHPHPVFGVLVCSIFLLFSLYLGIMAISKLNILLNSDDWVDTCLLEKMKRSKSRGLRTLIVMGIVIVLDMPFSGAADIGTIVFFVGIVIEVIVFALCELISKVKKGAVNNVSLQMIWQDVIQWLFVPLIIFGTYFFDDYFPNCAALGVTGIYIYFAVLYVISLGGSFLIGWLFTKKAKESKKKHWFINIRNVLIGAIAVGLVNTWEYTFWDWRGDGAHLGIRFDEVISSIILAVMVIAPAIATFIYNRKYSSKEAVK